MGFVIFNLDKETKAFYSYTIHKTIPSAFKNIEEVKAFVDKKNEDPEKKYHAILNTDENVFFSLAQKEDCHSIKSCVNEVYDKIDELRWEMDNLVSFVEKELKKEEEN